MSKRTRIPAPVGASSLLVIFSVLCFTAFAMLALSTVKADERLADASCESVQAYYRADCEAEEILGRLRNGETVDHVVRKGNYYTYSCTVSDTQVLSVVVKIDGQDYRIHQWKLEETTQWNPDQHMDLFEVEEIPEG